MPSHIRDTTATYDAVASEYLEATRDRGLAYSWLESFTEGLTPKSRVLDLGSGPGRDSVDFSRFGLHPVCLDRSIGMLKAGQLEYPNPRVLGDMLAIPFRDASVAGVWANACLLHLEPEEFERAVSEIARVLVPRGRLHLTVKEGAGSDWESERYGKRRWFQYWSETDLDRALGRLRFRIIRSTKQAASNSVWIVRQCVANE